MKYKRYFTLFLILVLVTMNTVVFASDEEAVMEDGVTVFIDGNTSISPLAAINKAAEKKQNHDAVYAVVNKIGVTPAVSRIRQTLTYFYTSDININTHTARYVTSYSDCYKLIYTKKVAIADIKIKTTALTKQSVDYIYPGGYIADMKRGNSSMKMKLEKYTVSSKTALTLTSDCIPMVHSPTVTLNMNTQGS